MTVEINGNNPRRLGRPPATSSVETEQRVLLVAREIFAIHGFEAATNRTIAEAAGITSGALYHYFGSKIALYMAVHEDVQSRVYAKFNEAVEGHETFLAKFEAILDAAYEMNVEDASVARFVGAVRVDAGRHPEMAAAVQPHALQRQAFFTELIDIGIAHGEIAPKNRLMTQAFILAVLIGLTDASSDDHNVQRRAIAGIKSALRGTFLENPENQPNP